MAGKVNLIASGVFSLANVLSISSLAYQRWIVNDFAGQTRLGLTKLCVVFKGQSYDEEKCETFRIPPHWAVTLVFIVINISLTFVTIFLLILGRLRPYSERMARLISFFGMMFSCIAAIIFPFGFDIPEIGGLAYKLPVHTQVGYSYFLFCTSILVSTIGVGLCNMDVIRYSFVR